MPRSPLLCAVQLAGAPPGCKIVPTTAESDTVATGEAGDHARVAALLEETCRPKLLPLIAEKALPVEELTEGRIEMQGRPVRFRSMAETVAHGIGIDPAAQSAAARILMRWLKQDIGPDMPPVPLRVGQQQIVVRAKALAQDVRILIPEELPTTLSAAEVEVFFS